jgi:predicted esterase
MAEDSAITAYRHRFEPGDASTSTGSWTLLLLHGTGGDENDLIPLGRTLLPGAAMLSPRGNVSEGGALRFFRRQAEGVLDLNDLAAKSSDMERWVAAAITTNDLASGKIIAVGFSNGANLAASMFLRGTRVLSAGVLLSPMFPFLPDPRPNLTGTAIFVGAGRNDPIVPADQVRALIQELRSSGGTVTEHWMTGGHGITPDELRAAQAWIADLTSSRNV